MPDNGEGMKLYTKRDILKLTAAAALGTTVAAVEQIVQPGIAGEKPQPVPIPSEHQTPVPQPTQTENTSIPTETPVSSRFDSLEGFSDEEKDLLKQHDIAASLIEKGAVVRHEKYGDKTLLRLDYPKGNDHTLNFAKELSAYTAEAYPTLITLPNGNKIMHMFMPGYICVSSSFMAVIEQHIAKKNPRLATDICIPPIMLTEVVPNLDRDTARNMYNKLSNEFAKYPERNRAIMSATATLLGDHTPGSRQGVIDILRNLGLETTAELHLNTMSSDERRNKILENQKKADYSILVFNPRPGQYVDHWINIVSPFENSSVSVIDDENAAKGIFNFKSTYLMDTSMSIVNITAT